MRLPSLLLTCAFFASFGVLGCTKATVIGTSCKVDGDCNVAGQVCAPGFNGGPNICTRKCTSNTGTAGCPAGYDCFPTDPAKGATCNKTLYEVDSTGHPLLFGKDCSLDYLACANTGTSNATPFCRKIPDSQFSMMPKPVETDPNAYCTGSCSSDFDCPLDFYCDTDFDGQKLCLKRTVCSPCTTDLNCPTDNPVCVPTKDGSSRYCTKSCSGNGDCGGNQNTALTCADTTNSAGDKITACLHRFGACVGQGNICDPCRKKEDCAKTMSTCFTNGATGERFCTKVCSSDAECKDYGSVASACDNDESQAMYGVYPTDICNGDAMHTTIGLFSCWLPQ